MTPTAKQGGRILSATGRYFFALQQKDKEMGYLIVFLGGGLGAALATVSTWPPHACSALHFPTARC